MPATDPWAVYPPWDGPDADSLAGPSPHQNPFDGFPWVYSGNEDFESGTDGTSYSVTSGLSSSGANSGATWTYGPSAGLTGATGSHVSVLNIGTSGANYRNILFQGGLTTSVFIQGSFSLSALPTVIEPVFVAMQGSNIKAQVATNTTGNFVLRNNTTAVFTSSAVVRFGVLYQVRWTLDGGRGKQWVSIYDQYGNFVDGTASAGVAFGSNGITMDTIRFGATSAPGIPLLMVFDNVGYHTVQSFAAPTVVTAPEGPQWNLVNPDVTAPGTLPPNLIWSFPQIDTLFTNWTVQPTDNPAGLVDNVVFAISPVYTDSAGLTDTVGIEQDKVYTDLAGNTDTNTSQAHAATALDLLGMWDSDAPIYGYGPGENDTSGLVDVVAIEQDRPYTDSTGLTDSANVVHGIGWTVQVDDPTGSVDTGLSEGHGGTALDLEGLYDSLIFLFAPSPVDDSGLTDSFFWSGNRSLVFTDDTGLVDGPTSLGHAGTVNDFLGSSDVSVHGPNPTDNAGLTDANVVVFPIVGRVGNDDSGMTDGVVLFTITGRVFDDPAGLADSPVAKTAAGTFQDASPLSDPDYQVNKVNLQGPTDDSGMTDSFIKDFLDQENDLAGVSDAFVTDQFKVSNENVGLTDTFALDFEFVVQNDTGLTDPSSVVRDQYTQGPTDLAGMTDSIIVQKVFGATDSAGLTDSVVFAINMQVDDTASIFDTDMAWTYNANLTEQAESSLSDGNEFAFDRHDYTLNFIDPMSIRDFGAAADYEALVFESPVLMDSTIDYDLSTMPGNDDSGMTDANNIFELGKNFPETMGLTDSIIIDRVLQFDDAMHNDDFFPPTEQDKVVGDDSGLVDYFGLGRGLGTLQDDSGLTDLAIVQKVQTPNDSAGLVDSIHIDFFGTNFVLQFDDPCGSADLSGITQARSFLDIMGLADPAFPVPTRLFSENAGLTDSATVQKILVFTDDTGMTDPDAPIIYRFTQQQRWIPNTTSVVLTANDRLLDTGLTQKTNPD